MAELDNARSVRGAKMAFATPEVSHRSLTFTIARGHVIDLSIAILQSPRAPSIARTTTAADAHHLSQPRGGRDFGQPTTLFCSAILRTDRLSCALALSRDDVLRACRVRHHRSNLAPHAPHQPDTRSTRTRPRPTRGPGCPPTSSSLTPRRRRGGHVLTTPTAPSSPDAQRAY
jgi:hypothetical protein